MMAIATENDIKLAELTVSEFFSIEVNNLYSRDRKRNTSNARAFLWLILHQDMKMSAAQIAKRYGRTRRNVFMQISGIKFLTEGPFEERSIYDKILGNLLDKQIAKK